MVVADLRLSPQMQAAKLDGVGVPTVLSPDRLAGPQLAAFDTARSDHRLDDLGEPLVELPVDEVPRLDQRWLAEVAR